MVNLVGSQGTAQKEWTQMNVMTSQDLDNSQARWKRARLMVVARLQEVGQVLTDQTSPRESKAVVGTANNPMLAPTVERRGTTVAENCLRESQPSPNERRIQGAGKHSLILAEVETKR
jgi:hypothetical protein